MLALICAVGLLAIGSLALFVVGVVDRRPQRSGLAFAIAGALLYVVYYGDVVLPESFTAARDALRPLGLVGHVDTGFVSSSAVALALIPIYLVEAAIFLRVLADTAVGNVSDRVVNFVSGVAAAVLLGGVVVAAFDGGYAPALGYAAFATSAYVLAAFFKDSAGLVGAAVPYLLTRVGRGGSAVVVGCAAVVSSIIARRDRLGAKVPDWTRRLQSANEVQRGKLKEQRETENAKLDAAGAARRGRAGGATRQQPVAGPPT